MQGCNKALTFLLVCLFGSENVSGLSQAKITGMAQVLCPEGDSRICATNSSHASTEQQATDTCCLDCSCDPSCTVYENCCFQNHNYPNGKPSTYTNNVKLFSESNTTVVKECLYPLSPQPKIPFVKIEHQSFWMISEVKGHDEPSTTQKCGLINVAPWGSLLPVSSKETGHIYKNIFCAKENFVKDENVVTWEAAYVCNVKRRVLELTETFVESCQLNFNAPRGLPISRSSFCFNDLIDTCPEEDFKIPSDATMNQSEVIEACTSGFLSPYRVGDMYANIFCHICNGLSTAPPYKCRKLSITFEERIGKKISAFIDNNYLQELAQDSDDRKQSTESIMACVNKDVDFESVAETCRPRFCPLGQIRNGKGQCIYVISRWMNVIFAITIELKCEDQFFSIDYFQHLRDQIANFESPLLKSFKITSIFYKLHNSFNVTNELLIFLSKKSDKASIKQVVNFVRKNVKKKWLFYTNNSTLTFSSDLSSLASTSKEMLKYVKKIFKEVYRGVKFSANGMAVPLTKLYFCENIRLAPNEFNVSRQNIVFDKISNRYLYDAEYSFAKSDGQNATCNICIDGSSFHVIGMNRSSGNSNTLGALHVVICVGVRYLMNGLYSATS